MAAESNDLKVVTVVRGTGTMTPPAEKESANG